MKAPNVRVLLYGGDVLLQPKFLTKEERAAEAIKRRQEQVESQRRIIDEERRKQDDFMKAAKESAGLNVTRIFFYLQKFFVSRLRLRL